ncbi:uroplakin-3b-like protein 2 [Nycticebus coucang]|uniref:uroplakin-3b-like protein 2 n=1 Tax=Nycticebus coucang TaxID=9470 RepID=UPI00234C71AD|nr:uroplakin-3b-like protein 2 [Nycticebus coucang]
MGHSRGQSQLLMPLLVLLTCVQTQMGLEHISYVPQLSEATLAGRLTQSTFALEQPRGLFSGPKISDKDIVYLVVAYSNATQNFKAPQSVEDSPVPANFSWSHYYLTLMAYRALYSGSQASSQLSVLRVGNNTHCAPTTMGCNYPLPGPGPYRVKFLVMNDKGPVAETEWSSEIQLLQAPLSAQAIQDGWGPQSPGTIVIIAILSIFLAILLTALLAVLIYTCFNSCRSAPISGQGETGNVRRYTTHHESTPAAGSS